MPRISQKLFFLIIPLIWPQQIMPDSRAFLQYATGEVVTSNLNDSILLPVQMGTELSESQVIHTSFNSRAILSLANRAVVSAEENSSIQLNKLSMPTGATTISLNSGRSVFFIQIIPDHGLDFGFEIGKTAIFFRHASGEAGRARNGSWVAIEKGLGRMRSSQGEEWILRPRTIAVSSEEGWILRPALSKKNYLEILSQLNRSHLDSSSPSTESLIESIPPPMFSHLQNPSISNPDKENIKLSRGYRLPGLPLDKDFNQPRPLDTSPDSSSAITKALYFLGKTGSHLVQTDSLIDTFEVVRGPVNFLNLRTPVAGEDISESNFWVAGSSLPGSEISIGTFTTVSGPSGRFLLKLPTPNETGKHEIFVESNLAGNRAGKNIHFYVPPEKLLNANTDSVFVQIISPGFHQGLQNNSISVTGRATPGAKISIAEASEIADSTGHWESRIMTPNQPGRFQLVAEAELNGILGFDTVEVIKMAGENDVLQGKLNTVSDTITSDTLILSGICVQGATVEVGQHQVFLEENKWQLPVPLNNKKAGLLELEVYCKKQSQKIELGTVRSLFLPASESLTKQMNKKQW